MRIVFDGRDWCCYATLERFTSGRPGFGKNIPLYIQGENLRFLVQVIGRLWFIARSEGATSGGRRSVYSFGWCFRSIFSTA